MECQKTHCVHILTCPHVWENTLQEQIVVAYIFTYTYLEAVLGGVALESL